MTEQDSMYMLRLKSGRIAQQIFFIEAKLQRPQIPEHKKEMLRAVKQSQQKAFNRIMTHLSGNTTTKIQGR